MSNELKQQLIKRLKSLAWRVGGVAVIGLLAIGGEFIGKFGLPEIVVVSVGLVINELTKFVNNEQKNKLHN